MPNEEDVINALVLVMQLILVGCILLLLYFLMITMNLWLPVLGFLVAFLMIAKGFQLIRTHNE